MIASADKVIKLWDMNGGQMKRQLNGHTASVTQVAFHPSIPDFLVSSSMDKTLKVWNITTGKFVANVYRREI